MRNQKGVTMIMLVAIIAILIILASVTIISSLTAYRQMRYNTFTAVMDEVQGKVDEICADYKLKGYDSYTEYFSSIYGDSPDLLENVSSKKIDYIASTYQDELLGHEEYVFYFSSDEVKKYLDLSGIDDDSFIIDFSTRYIFSVNGCKDPKNTEIVYHTPTEYKNSILSNNAGIIDTNESEKESALQSISGSNVEILTRKVGNTTIYIVNLKVSYATDGIKYPIKRIFFSKGTKENWVEVTNYKENAVKNTIDIEFTLTESGSYKFKVEDTSGKTVESGLFSTK